VPQRFEVLPLSPVLLLILVYCLRFYFTPQITAEPDTLRGFRELLPSKISYLIPNFLDVIVALPNSLPVLTDFAIGEFLKLISSKGVKFGYFFW
jgi:hypothetical protein